MSKEKTARQVCGQPPREDGGKGAPEEQTPPAPPGEAGPKLEGPPTCPRPQASVNPFWCESKPRSSSVQRTKPARLPWGITRHAAGAEPACLPASHPQLTTSQDPRPSPLRAFLRYRYRPRPKRGCRSPADLNFLAALRTPRVKETCASGRGKLAVRPSRGAVAAALSPFGAAPFQRSLRRELQQSLAALPHPSEGVF